MLSDREKAVLEFARLRWKYEGARESAILAYFGVTGVRFAQVLAGVLERPAAVAYDAALVRRLRASIERRRPVARREGFDL